MSLPSKSAFLSTLRPLSLPHHPSLCPICHNTSHAPIRLPCSHSFCLPCLLAWTSATTQQKHNKCPTCLTGLFRKSPSESHTKPRANSRGRSETRSAREDEGRARRRAHRPNEDTSTETKATTQHSTADAQGTSDSSQNDNHNHNYQRPTVSTAPSSSTHDSTGRSPIHEARLAGFAAFVGYTPQPRPSTSRVPPRVDSAGAHRVASGPTITPPVEFLTTVHEDPGAGFASPHPLGMQAEHARRNPNAFSRRERPPPPVDEEEERVERRRAAWWGE